MYGNMIDVENFENDVLDRLLTLEKKVCDLQKDLKALS